LKKIHQKRSGGAGQGVGPEFKPQYLKKQKTSNKKKGKNIVFLHFKFMALK
jgi:hypothetical protein